MSHRPEHLTQYARGTLRWKLFGIVAVLILAVATLFLALVRQSIEQFARRDEIGRLRRGTLEELKRRCTDYLTDRDRAAIERHMAALVTSRSEIAYLCFLDEDLDDDGLLASESTLTTELLPIVQRTEPVPPDGETWHVNGERVVDITETTTTKPAYTLHLGLRQTAINKRTGELLFKMTAIAAIIVLIAIAVALGAIILIVGPIERLAADATRLSLGDMRVTFAPRGRSELAQLADALDRMRESVLCALRRTRRHDASKK